jgi:hypothetical protein
MPEAEKVKREEQVEEEEKKFPVWIIPLVAGPVVLIILIAVLAGDQTPGGGSGEPVFNEEQLTEEALEYYSEASKLRFDAVRARTQRQKDKIYDKALKISAKAMDNLNKIYDYYEKHKIEHTGGGNVWQWERIMQDVGQLIIDISRDRGMTGYTSQSP